MLWTCSRDGHSGMLQGHWHWVDRRRAAFVRFWVAGRSDSWSVLAFGAKWIISGWQAVRCGRTPRTPPDAQRALRGTRAALRPLLFGRVAGCGRGAVGLRPQPAYDPGATGELFVTLWTFRDDGPTAARGPPRGPAAGQASDPRTRGDAKRQLVRAGFWRQMDNQRTASSSMRKAGLHHKCILMAQSATCASVRRLSWHTHN